MSNGDSIIGLVPLLVGTAALIAVVKVFKDPKTGKKTEYELHSTHNTKKEAAKESKELRDSGMEARYTKAGKEFKVWISKKASGIWNWPF